MKMVSFHFWILTCHIGNLMNLLNIPRNDKIALSLDTFSHLFAKCVFQQYCIFPCDVLHHFLR